MATGRLEMHFADSACMVAAIGEDFGDGGQAAVAAGLKLVVGYAMVPSWETGDQVVPGWTADGIRRIRIGVGASLAYQLV